MAHSFGSALENNLVTIAFRGDDAERYCIISGKPKTPVTITLRRLRGSEAAKFIVGHAITTPLLADPYRPSSPFVDYPAYALHRAIDGLTSEYSATETKGYRPNEDWLVEN